MSSSRWGIPLNAKAAVDRVDANMMPNRKGIKTAGQRRRIEQSLESWGKRIRMVRVQIIDVM